MPAKPEYEYEVRYTLRGKTKTAEWNGHNGPDACARFADCHPGVTVYAWRPARYQVLIYGGEPILP